MRTHIVVVALRFERSRTRINVHLTMLILMGSGRRLRYRAPVEKGGRGVEGATNAHQKSIKMRERENACGVLELCACVRNCTVLSARVFGAHTINTF